MAQFPALSPSAAPITFGAVPVTTASSLNGSESRIRHGTAEIGRRLRLTFENVSESDFLAILSHYREQRGGFDSFGFSTTTLAAALTPSGHAWLYASPPQVVDEHVNVFTVACEFQAEPRGLMVAPGDTWRSFFSTFTPGARSNGIVSAAGVPWVTSSTTFTPGRTDFPLSPVAWFDGSDATARTIVSGAFSALNDKSGNGWNLAQSDSSLRPALASSAINGLDAIQWPNSGNAKRLFNTNSATFTTAVVYAIVQWTDGSTFTDFCGIFNANDNGSSYWLIAQGGGTGLNVATFDTININSGSTNKVNNLLPDISSPRLIRATITGSGTVSTTSGLALGMDRNYGYLSRGWHGLIGELVAFASVPSAGDDARIREILMTKWGLS